MADQQFKADAGKQRCALLVQDFPQALMQISKVATFGANKYTAHSWRRVDCAAERYVDAMMRHLLAHMAGEMLDAESGLPHYAHFAWGALATLELMQMED